MPSDPDELHWFRRLLLFILGSGLLAGGLTYATLVLQGARILSGWFALGAGFMVALGGFILWQDIARPALRFLHRRFVPPSAPPSSDTSHRGGGRTR